MTDSPHIDLSQAEKTPVLPEVEGGRDFDEEDEERLIVTNLYNQQITLASGIAQHSGYHKHGSN
jgi:hypothetical protein